MKRVVGVAGDTIRCCDAQGRIIVNGVHLDEDDYIRVERGDCNGPMPVACRKGKAKKYWQVGPVPEGHIFVMGDNRSHSADSSEHICTRRDARRTGCVLDGQYVPVDNVVGKVFVLLWPRDHFRWVTRPDSFADVEDRS